MSDKRFRELERRAVVGDYAALEQLVRNPRYLLMHTQSAMPGIPGGCLPCSGLGKDRSGRDAWTCSKCGGSGKSLGTARLALAAWAGDEVAIAAAGPHPNADCDSLEDVLRILSGWGPVPVVLGVLAVENLRKDAPTKHVRARNFNRRRRAYGFTLTNLEVPERQDKRANSKARTYLTAWAADPSPENAALVYGPGARYTSTILRAASKYVHNYRTDSDPEATLFRGLGFLPSFDAARIEAIRSTVGAWALGSLLTEDF